MLKFNVKSTNIFFYTLKLIAWYYLEELKKNRKEIPLMKHIYIINISENSPKAKEKLILLV